MSNRRRLQQDAYFLTINSNTSVRRESSKFKAEVNKLKDMVDKTFDKSNYSNLFNVDPSEIRNVEIYKALEIGSRQSLPHVHILIIIHRYAKRVVHLNYSHIREMGKKTYGKAIHFHNDVVRSKTMENLNRIKDYMTKGQINGVKNII